MGEDEPYTYVWTADSDEIETGDGEGPGNWNPPVGGDAAQQQIVYDLLNTGATQSIVANFDDDGCITNVTHDDTESGVNIHFVEPGSAVHMADVETEVDAPVEVDVRTANHGAGTLGAGWYLGLEVDNLEAANDLTLEHRPESGDDWVDLDDLTNVIDDGDTVIVQVVGLDEDEDIDPSDADQQAFRATFHEAGTFTGEVFVFGQNVDRPDPDPDPEPDTYQLSVDSTDGGEVTEPGEDTFEYEEGTEVDLVAVADEGYEFDGWDGDVGRIDDPDAAETSITMNDDASITATFEEDEPEPDPLFEAGEFTMFAEGGELVVGQDLDDPEEEPSLEMELTECPGGEPTDPEDECISFEGEIDEDGDFTVPADGVSFPVAEIDDPIDITATITASDDITGNIDPDSGEADFNLPLQVDLAIGHGEDAEDACRLIVDLDGTTGSSGEVTGSPLDTDGRLTGVDGLFGVPATDDIGGGPACALIIDGALDLPADEEGQNIALFDLLMVQ